MGLSGKDAQDVRLVHTQDLGSQLIPSAQRYDSIAAGGATCRICSGSTKSTSSALGTYFRSLGASNVPTTRRVLSGIIDVGLFGRCRPVGVRLECSCGRKGR